jgi:hypothetical protein
VAFCGVRLASSGTQTTIAKTIGTTVQSRPMGCLKF